VASSTGDGDAADGGQVRRGAGARWRAPTGLGTASASEEESTRRGRELGHGRERSRGSIGFIGRERERRRGEERSVITTPLMAINGGLHYGKELGRDKEEVAAVSGAGEDEGTRASLGRGAGRCPGRSRWRARRREGTR
jgi:hypothetical protein